MKKFLVLLLTCTLVLSLTGCASSKGKLDKIKKNGKMVVYTDPNFSPFEFMKGTEVVGVDIEIAKAIGEELDVNVEFKETNFDSIIAAIKSGKGDIAISGFTITDERKKSVDFSNPYIESVQYLILMEDSEIAVLEDLKDLKVGVAHGYTGHFLMEDELDEKEGGALAGTQTSISEYKSAMEAVLDLKSGRIDAVVMDEYVAKNIVSKNDGYKTIELRYESGDLAAEEYGVVVAKGNEDLLEVINKVVKNLVDEGKIPEWVIQYSE